MFLRKRWAKSFWPCTQNGSKRGNRPAKWTSRERKTKNHPFIIYAYRWSVLRVMVCLCEVRHTKGARAIVRFVAITRVKNADTTRRSETRDLFKWPHRVGCGGDILLYAEVYRVNKGSFPYLTHTHTHTYIIVVLIFYCTSPPSPITVL